MSDPSDDFAHMWAWFATHCEGYSPLYERVSVAVAGDRELLDLVRSAPPDAHLPPALLAAVHFLVLGGVDDPLADIYAGRSDADPGPPFLDFCRSHRQEVMTLLSTRSIQTNECGRSTLIGPGLTWLAARHDGPLALVDVGASAGLNLLCDRYHLDYGSQGSTGPPDSPVTITCEVRAGHPPIADRLPVLVERVGIDRSPIDLTKADDARWLLACVWPDTDRLGRAAASIRLGQENPPRVVAGDANEALPGILSALPSGAAALVVTTWAFAYLPIPERQRFVELLEAESHARDVAWLSAEGTATVDAFVEEAAADPVHAQSDVLGAVMFHRGEQRAQLLAFVQEHGNWMEWRGPAG